MQNSSPKKFYFGWWPLITSFLLMALVFTPNANLYGQFIKPISGEFSSTRTAVTLITTITTISSMVGAMFWGRLLMRFNLKKVLSALLVFLAAAYFGSALATSLYLLYALAIVRGIAVAGLTMVPISIIINNWFGVKVRGRVLGIAMVGSGVGSIVLNPVTGVIISRFGWRAAYVFFGILALVLLPAVIFSYVRQPSDIGVTRYGDPDPGTEAPSASPSSGMTSTAALKTSSFWCILVALVLSAGVSHIWNSSGVPYLGDLGFDAVTAAAVFSISSYGLTFGKLFLGYVFDKWGIRRGVILSALCLLFANVLLYLSGHRPVFAMIAPAFMGFGMSIVTMSAPLLIVDFFGNRDYGTLVSYTQVGTNLGSSILPIAVTLVFDLTGSYRPAWVMSALLTLVFAALLFFAYHVKPAEPAAPVSDSETVTAP